MFYINTPKTLKIGETHDCRINGEPAKITWRDATTLVIEPGDARVILHTRIDGELRVFMCGDSTSAQGYTVEQSPEGVCITNTNLY